MTSFWDWGNQALDYYNNNPALQLGVQGGLSYLGSSGQRDANNTSTGQIIQGQQQGLDTLNKTWGTAQKQAQPYLNFGNAGVKQYTNLINNPNSIRKDPGYLFRLAEGSTNLERSAAAAGTHLSGNTLADLTKYGQNYATAEYDKALNRRIPMIETGLSTQQNLAQLGAGYADAIGQIYGTMGGVRAAGTQGNEAARQGTIGDIRDMLSRLSDGGSNLRSLTTGADELSNLTNAGNGNPFAAARDMLPGSGNEWANAPGPRTSARMPSNGSLATLGTVGSMTGLGTNLGGGMYQGTEGLITDFTNVSSVGGKATAGVIPAASPLNSVTNFLSSAPGMGIVAGVLTGITTGDWKKGAIVGGSTYAGAAAGTAIMPGIGTVVGGVLGGLLGGKIGPQPSDKAQGISIDSSGKSKQWGELSGDKFSPDMRKAADSLGKQISTMQKTISSAFPGVKFSNIGATFGERDGLRLNYGKYGQSPTVRNYGYNQQSFAKGVADAIISSMGGLPPRVINAISRVNFSNKALAKQQLKHIKDTMMPTQRTR